MGGGLVGGLKRIHRIRWEARGRERGRGRGK